jgi:hypothetical protein
MLESTTSLALGEESVWSHLSLSKMTEAEIIRARIKVLKKKLATLEAALRTLERDKAIAAFHHDNTNTKTSIQ